MPRSKAILQPDFPYNVTARCINREWFNLPMDEVWEIFSEELFWVSRTHNFKIHSFVLMSNHFHLIVRTPDSNISSGMQQFMRSTSWRLTRAGNRINETYAGRHYKTILDTNSYFLNAYKYNFLNPVKAGLCERVEQYPYSSLNRILGFGKILFPVENDDDLMADTSRILRELNKVPEENNWNAVENALRRPYFRFRHHSSKRAQVVDSDMMI